MPTFIVQIVKMLYFYFHVLKTFKYIIAHSGSEVWRKPTSVFCDEPLFDPVLRFLPAQSRSCCREERPECS